MLRRFICMTCIAVASCVLDLPDLPGLACDDQHACEQGRVCASGVCTAPRTWSQRADGFSGMDVFPGAQLSLGADNAVTSTVPNANDAHDRATAVASMPLPTTGDGHLSGTFRLPAALDLQGSSTWLYLGTATQELVSLAFDATGAIVCGAQTASIADGFSPGVDYSVDVSWKHGDYLRLSVNGMPLVEGDPGATVLDPDQLRLGIFRYDGAADTGWSIELSGWELTDTP